MSRNKKRNNKEVEKGAFKRFLTTLVVLALVFSAGMIFGKRIASGDSVIPLMAVKSVKPRPAVIPVINTGEEHLGTDYSFYEILTTHSDGTDSHRKGGRREEGAQVVEEKKGTEKARVAEKSEKREPTKVVDTAKKSLPAARDEAPKVAQSDAKYTLQIGSHTSKRDAEEEMQSLEKLGVKPYLLTVDVPQRGTFYRVRIGKYANLVDARHAQSMLQENQKISSFVSPI